MTARTDFPDAFLWGVATSSYQIEGAVAEDGRGPSIWDTFSHTKGLVRNGDTGDVACDHYHRLEPDLDLIASIGVGAYRFSVAWPRVLPEGRGRANTRGLDFYDRLVDGLLERGVAPWATLYHWDLPQALQDKGGWANRDTALAFLEYADATTARLGDRVAGWITHNEPWCAAFLGHLLGIHAPGVRDERTALLAAHHLLLSHGLAAPVVRGNAPLAPVGITLNLTPVHPHSDSGEDEAAAGRFDGHFNRWFLDPLFGRGYPADILGLYGDLVPEPRPGDMEVIAVPIDFLGVNYYNRSVVFDAPGEGPLGLRFHRPEGEYTAFDWEVYPDGLRELLVRVARDYGPAALFVTENGAAYEDRPAPDGSVNDEGRRRYLERHMDACAAAVREGAPLQGYFAWSLMDNFEWAEGYDKRFGLTWVDFATQERRLKRSGEWFRDFLRTGEPAPV